MSMACLSEHEANYLAGIELLKRKFEDPDKALDDAPPAGRVGTRSPPRPMVIGRPRGLESTNEAWMAKLSRKTDKVDEYVQVFREEFCRPPAWCPDIPLCMRRDRGRELRMTTGGWRINFVLAWYDLWIGADWDRKARKLYILPLPCVGVVIEWGLENQCK
jgi:hypothetical protein